MNKNIFKLLSLLFVFALAFVSCEDELVKSDYDYVMNPDSIPMGAVTVGATDTTFVSISISGSVAADSTQKDWGVVYYTAPMLEKGTFYVASAKDSKKNYAFVIPISGLIPNTVYYYKTFSLNEDGIAYGTQKSFKTKPPLELPFEIKSTDAVTKWQAIPFLYVDGDGDGNKWGLGFLNTAKTLVGLKSYSYTTKALKPENYVVFPPIRIGAAVAKIEMEIKAADADYPAEKYKVIISTSPISSKSTASTGEILFTETLVDNVAALKTIAIPAKYANKVVWISVCHFDCTDQYYMSINSIKVY